jgi:hypothetical protein
VQIGDSGPSVAARGGHAKVIERLVVDGRCDLAARNTFGWAPMLSAADRGHAECITQLHRGGASVVPAPSVEGNFCVLRTSEQGHEEALKRLRKYELTHTAE